MITTCPEDYICTFTPDTGSDFSQMLIFMIIVAITIIAVSALIGVTDMYRNRVRNLK